MLILNLNDLTIIQNVKFDWKKLFGTYGYAVRLLGVSALHYSTGSQISEGVQTVASACVLCQPTVTCLGISIVSVQKFES